MDLETIRIHCPMTEEMSRLRLREMRSCLAMTEGNKELSVLCKSNCWFFFRIRLDKN